MLNRSFQSTSIESKRDKYVPNWNRDQLLASAEEGNRAGEDAISPVEMPELFARACVKSVEVPARRGREDQVPRSRERPSPGRRQYAMLPLDLSRLRRHGDQTAPALFGPKTRSTATATAEVGFARSEFRGVGLEVTTPLLARIEIKELRIGIVAGRHPVVAAVHAGPDRVVAFRARLLIRVENRTALFIKLLRPGLLHILFGQQEGARYTVEDIMEAVAAGHDHQFARASVKRRIEQDRNLRGVPIVCVVRSELEIPLQLSGVHIQREQ